MLTHRITLPALAFAALTLAARDVRADDPVTPQEVAAGGVHVCARMSDGGVRCWGGNDHGQLGDGTQTPRPRPVAVPALSGVAQLALGGAHSCARLVNGTVRCWGNNDDGQLGDGTRTTRLTPVGVVGLRDVVELAAGDAHTCARLRSGVVQCWGDGLSGQLGTPRAVAQPRPTRVPGLPRAAQIAAGGEHNCIRTEDHAVWCWGANGDGQLGTGVLNERARPTAVRGLTDVAQVATGGRHTCVRTRDGRVQCWGNDSLFDRRANPLPAGSHAESDWARALPVPVAGITDAVDLVLAGSFACVRSADGGVRCWGGNEYDQLGEGPRGRRREPVRIQALGPATQLALGGEYTGAEDSGHACALLQDGTVRCWGSNLAGQRGTGTIADPSPGLDPSPHGVVGLANAVEIAAGGNHACARRTDGSVVCWGDNHDGTLGDGTYTDRAEPAAVAGLAAASALSLGGEISCAMAGGSARCWGANEYGQIGDGTLQTRPAPTVVPGLANVAEIAAGTLTTYARMNDGTVRWWGRTDWSQPIGVTDHDFHTPTVMRGIEHATRLRSNGVTCAVLEDATVRCTGSNRLGSLGDGTSDERTGWVAVAGLQHVTDVAPGGYHTCALTADGAVWCWGGNSSGQVGSESTALCSDEPCAPRAVRVPGLPAIAQIASGTRHACAVARDGSVWCWGAGNQGQLGRAAGEQPGGPAVVPGISHAAQVALGDEFSCARLQDGSVRCWGYWAHGERGDGSAMALAAPAVVQW